MQVISGITGDLSFVAKVGNISQSLVQRFMSESSAPAHFGAEKVQRKFILVVKQLIALNCADFSLR